MKEYYDKNAYVREFRQGDAVLVFLSVDTSKLHCKWQGQYVIYAGWKRSTMNNYGRPRKKLRVVHVNRIKKWYSREDEQRIATSMYVCLYVY